MTSNLKWRYSIRQVLRTGLTAETAVRVLADAVMVSFSLLVAYTVRYVSAVSAQHLRAESPSIALDACLRAYGNDVWLLILVSLTVFALSGFYTYGRAYRGRFKALVVVQAVSVSYLVLAALNYFTPTTFATPRSVLFGSYLISVLLLVGARLWSTVWKVLAAWELRRMPRPQNSRIRSVLVIGGAGYIGSMLLPRLLEEGYQVRVLDLFLYGRDSIADYLSQPNLEVVEGDFRDVQMVVDVMQGMDAVVHLGAIVGDPACDLNEQITIEINLIATRMIAEVAKGSGASRLVFASTCSVYGANDNVLDEQSALNPVSLYARSKMASEQLLMQMADETFSPVILRFATIYGLSPRMRFDLVVNLLTAKALGDGKITLYGGDQWRPFVHVDDVALGIVAALRARRAQVHSQVFNVGSYGQNHTLREVGELIESLVPGSQVVEMGTNEDRRNYRVNFAKIYNALHYLPEWSMERGVKQTIEAIQSGVFDDYQSPEYSNVKLLGELENEVLVAQEGWADALIGQGVCALDERRVVGL